MVNRSSHQIRIDLEALLTKKEFQQAISLVENCVENSQEKSFLLGYCYFKKQEYDLAETYFLESISHTPSADVYYYLGEVATRRYHYGKAYNYLLHALDLAPEEWSFHQVTMELLDQLQQIDSC